MLGFVYANVAHKRRPIEPETMHQALDGHFLRDRVRLFFGGCGGGSYRENCLSFIQHLKQNRKDDPIFSREKFKNGYPYFSRIEIFHPSTIFSTGSFRAAIE